MKSDGVYTTITTEEQLARLVSDCLDFGLVAIDVETTSTDQLSCGLVGISLTCRVGVGYYIPLAHQTQDEQLLLDVVRPYMAMLTTNSDIEKIFFNATFDMTVLERFEMSVVWPIRDMMIAAWRRDNGRVKGMSMAAVVKREFDIDMISITDLIGSKGKNQITFDRVSIEQATEYAAADVDMPLRLFKSISADPSIYAITPVLQQMTMTGVSVSREYLEVMTAAIDPALKKQQQIVNEIAGRSIYITSNQKLADFLFNELELKPDGRNKKLKSDQYSVAKDRLALMTSQHPIVSEIIRFKSLSHMRRQVLNPLVWGMCGDRAHPYFNQITSTGRLATGSPNLQNMPTFTIEGYHIRKAFQPDPGCIWVRADYSQVELRVLAHILVKEFDDWRYAEIFQRGDDVHWATAVAMYDISMDQIIDALRGNGKKMNFRIIYGSGPGGIAYALGISFQQGVQFLEAYLGRYPAVRRWMEWQPAFGDKYGYVESPFGFRRYISKGWRNQQLNTPCQAGAAEIIKQAMVNIYDEFNRRGLRTQMLLQVHDELDFSVPDEELEEVIPLIKHLMENAVKLVVPLVVDMEQGPNWGQLSAIADN